MNNQEAGFSCKFVMSIKHRILATFNINKKNQFERLYAFKNTLIDIDQYLYDLSVCRL
jgi:hypothetical protein